MIPLTISPHEELSGLADFGMPMSATELVRGFVCGNCGVQPVSCTTTDSIL